LVDLLGLALGQPLGDEVVERVLAQLVHVGQVLHLALLHLGRQILLLFFQIGVGDRLAVHGGDLRARLDRARLAGGRLRGGGRLFRSGRLGGGERGAGEDEGGQRALHRRFSRIFPTQRASGTAHPKSGGCARQRKPTERPAQELEWPSTTRL